MSRTAWVPDFGNGPELYQQVEVPEPGDPGWPGADLPEGDPWAPAVNQLRAEIAADYAAAEAEAEREAAENQATPGRYYGPFICEVPYRPEPEPDYDLTVPEPEAEP